MRGSAAEAIRRRGEKVVVVNVGVFVVSDVGEGVSWG